MIHVDPFTILTCKDHYEYRNGCGFDNNLQDCEYSSNVGTGSGRHGKDFCYLETRVP